MSDPVGVGVIGAGAIAQIAHLVALSRMDGVEAVALCDNDLPKAQALARRFGIPDVYDDIEDLLRHSKPDAVAVCTPNHLHEVHVLTALSAGVHVLCERPLALSTEGIERVIAASEPARRTVMVGMNSRFRTDVQAVRAFLAGGELGALRSIRAGWYIFRPTGAAAGWRVRRQESGGGAMLDLGLPLIDLALWLAGCPATKRVTAAFSGEHDDEAVEESGCALILCEHDLSIFVDVSWRHVGQDERYWFDLLGADGSAALAPLRVFKEMHGTPMNVTPSGAASGEDAFSASYRAEWAHFIALVRGEVPRVSLDDQLTLHRTLDAIHGSAREGREVSL